MASGLSSRIDDLVCQIFGVTSLLGVSLSSMLGISGWTLQLWFQGLHCDVQACSRTYASLVTGVQEGLRRALAFHQ